MKPQDERPILILGGGINGAALARELAANRLTVCLVDSADVAGGATANSSRLIHGGLRYLEYGEFDLVRESLSERTALLRLAPQFVRPLQLFVPIRTRFSGLLASAKRMLGGKLSPGYAPAAVSRGLYLVRSGLVLYDQFAKSSSLPRHSVHRTGDPQAAPLDARQFPWQCSFYDAQIQFPERFVLALLEDGRRLADAAGRRFEVFTYHRARIEGKAVEIVPLATESCTQTQCEPAGTPTSGEVHRVIEPAAIINATGAWVDLTLQDLQIESPRLIGGTKGSHFLTSNESLRATLAGRGLYAEAADGRPFFILPLGEQALIGTTDLPFSQDPREAIAEPAELDYLIEAVNGVIPSAQLTPTDIDWHYCGVRPLPFSNGSTPAGITRRHWLTKHPTSRIPCYSMIGGKLTTCRSLAVEAADAVLRALEWPRQADTTNLVVSGGEDYPVAPDDRIVAISRIAARTGFREEQVQSVWRLCGVRTEAVLAEAATESKDDLDGTHLPLAFARWSVRNEQVHCLDDLIERRLMLLYQPNLTRRCLSQLTGLLVEQGRLNPSDADAAVDRTIQGIARRHGKRVLPLTVNTDTNPKR